MKPSSPPASSKNPSNPSNQASKKRLGVSQPKMPPRGGPIGAKLFDLILFVLLGLWIFGGFRYQDHLYLRHGADPRRVALIFGVGSYFLFPGFRRRSFLMKGFLQFGKLLAWPRFRGIFYGVISVAAVSVPVLQTLALRSTLYDVGIFHQILWSLTHGLGFNSTVSGAGNFLQDHFSPSLLLLVPFFWLARFNPLFLGVMQTFFLFGGAGAWIFLAARLRGVTFEFRQKLAAATVVFVLSFDSLWGNLRWGFHENALAFFGFSWAFALLFSREEEARYLKGSLRKAVAYLLFLVAACSKEILLLDVGSGFLVWGIIELIEANESHMEDELDSSRPYFCFLLWASALVLFWQFFAFETSPHPSDKNYFNRYYAYLGHDLFGFFVTLFTSPLSIVRAVGGAEIIKYLWTVFSPWLFLPFLVGVNRRPPVFTWPIGWLAIIIPSFLSAALATYPPLRGADFHYVLELWPVLATLTLVTLGRLRSSRLVWLWAGFMLLRMDHDPLSDVRENWRLATELGPVRAQFRSVPDGASVVADELAGPWVAGHPSVTRWPDVASLPDQCPDFIFVKYSDQGTLAELGVRSIISRCTSATREIKRNSDLVPPVPIWRLDDWSEYQVNTVRKSSEKKDAE
jgi:uncharacterized membrane protein